ncbi:CRADD [Branchiostoma lanceolatum]|uniref:CRADD protein n=1 Tax=Branchiostoma lanceolatum TaxID=7740 RepID=A0A8K0EKX6_BRALA|nr:CRADD [Branchiostoma lanceolatum]
MDATDRERLIRNRIDLLDSLNVHDVIHYLYQEGIFSEDDMDRTYAGTTRQDQVRVMLDLLVLRGPHAYSMFRHALQENYPWLLDKLDKTDVSNVHCPKLFKKQVWRDGRATVSETRLQGQGNVVVQAGSNAVVNIVLPTTVRRK